ncbi:MAG: hypothetical protein EAX96_13925 [Candidatus Lokiarchaeota archaeon]|nr:hypothetical protein [Candidatus Lokiarchaeota archaeon]
MELFYYFYNGVLFFINPKFSIYIIKIGLIEMLGMQIHKWYDTDYNAQIIMKTVFGERQVFIKEKDKNAYEIAIKEAFKKLLT